MVAVQQSVKLRSLNADKVEAQLLLLLVEAFEDEATMSMIEEGHKRTEKARAATEDNLEAAHAESAALKSERANVLKRQGRLTDDEADAILDDLDAGHQANAERIARLEDDAHASVSVSPATSSTGPPIVSNGTKIPRAVFFKAAGMATRPWRD
jgi:hypothetical protein